MEEKQLNIKSSTIEKGLELAQNFLGKIISSPAMKEVGMVVFDQVRSFRYKRQIDTLVKTEKYAKERGIKLKEIPIKILVPLLENASLEDNEEMQDKWVKMLTNMVDSECNLQNQIFPYILSQISITEFESLKNLRLQEREFSILYSEYLKQRENDKYSFEHKTRELRDEVIVVDQGGFHIPLEEYELSNLARLALIKQLPPRIYIPEVRTKGGDYDEVQEFLTVEAEYDQQDYGYRITELGQRFLDIVNLKQKRFKYIRIYT